MARTHVTQEMLQKKVAFIEEAATAYRKQAAQDGIREITEDAWGKMMQARMRVRYEGREDEQCES